MEESTSSEKTKVSCILVERVYKEKSKPILKIAEEQFRFVLHL
jgi:hypothetical protein